MFLGWTSGTETSWHEMACIHAIKLSYLPKHHGHMWDICGEKPLSQANTSLVTRDSFIFLVVGSGQNCAKTFLTVEQYRWLSSSAQGISWHSLISRYGYFHRILLLSWVVEVQQKALTVICPPTYKTVLETTESFSMSVKSLMLLSTSVSERAPSTVPD